MQRATLTCLQLREAWNSQLQESILHLVHQLLQHRHPEDYTSLSSTRQIMVICLFLGNRQQQIPQLQFLVPSAGACWPIASRSGYPDNSDTDWSQFWFWAHALVNTWAVRSVYYKHLKRTAKVIGLMRSYCSFSSANWDSRSDIVSMQSVRLRSLSTSSSSAKMAQHSVVHIRQLKINL